MDVVAMYRVLLLPAMAHRLPRRIASGGGCGGDQTSSNRMESLVGSGGSPRQRDNHQEPFPKRTLTRA